MRNALLFGFVFALLTFSCKNERRLAIEGSWRMVYGDWMASDSSTYPAKISGSQIKTWTKEYFTFVGEFKRGDRDVEAAYGGGTYTLIGKRYTENAVYQYTKAYLNNEVRILLEIKGDTFDTTLAGNNRLEAAQKALFRKIRSSQVVNRFCI